ncbi:dicarboxylate/amino acid:cation symporter, partial [Polaribacter sp.]|uniref:dicarboxylate/amino acid:cation symporter n=1 Tax=Polaribacter sp. TaxID=1920175 RepID=UPI003F6D615F
MKKLALHWKILIGMVLGIIFGFIMNTIDGGKGFVTDWISPFGTIFINLLKLIAVPLILASLIKGISDLKDISKIKKMGLRTISIYVGTTLVAIIIGLGIVNLVKPGTGMSADTIEKIKTKYENSADVTDKLTKATAQNDAGPLQALVDIFPSNIFQSFVDASML